MKVGYSMQFGWIWQTAPKSSAESPVRLEDAESPQLETAAGLKRPEERGCSSVVERMLCMNEAPGSIPGISMDYYVVMYVSECIFQRGSMTIFTHTGWHKNASAGNRTRVNCLEGSYAHHYTTDALQYIKVATKWKFFCSAGKRRKSVKPNLIFSAIQ